MLAGERKREASVLRTPRRDLSFVDGMVEIGTFFLEKSALTLVSGVRLGYWFVFNRVEEFR